MIDFADVHDQMKAHGMNLPKSKVNISIPGAKVILENCFKYFLGLENTGFIWQSEYEKVANWLENNNGKGLMLYGDCGRGKSVLCRYVLPAILLKYQNKVVSVYDVQEINTKLDEVLNKHIISIDDIGTEEISVNFGNKRLAFSEIIDFAEKYGKLIIISTNLNAKELKEKYGERVIERIVSTMSHIEFKGKSLRK